MASTAALETWQIGYVVEQQDLAFRVARKLLIDLRKGDTENVPAQMATLTTTMASQAEVIAGMASLLRAVPTEVLEKAAASVRADLESGSGDS